jgi:hypothetical protein
LEKKFANVNEILRSQLYTLNKWVLYVVLACKAAIQLYFTFSSVFARNPAKQSLSLYSKAPDVSKQVLLAVQLMLSNMLGPNECSLLGCDAMLFLL